MAKTPAQERKERIYSRGGELLGSWVGGIPNMENMTPQGLVDQIGMLSEIEKDAKKVKEILKGILPTKYNPDDPNIGPMPKQIFGEEYVFELKGSDRTALNQEKAKAYFEGIDRLAEFMTTTYVPAQYFSRID